MNILIKDVNAILPEGVVKQTDIGVKDDKIAFIGDVPADFTADKIISGKDKLATPGFVNAHTHVSMTLLRSYADDMQLMDWLENKIWPIEAKMKKEDIYWGAMLGIAEMLKGGTTAFADMYGDMEQVAQACIDTDIRAVLSRGMIGVAPNGMQALEENKELFRDFNNANDGKITVMFGPHAPYTCPPDFLRKVVAVSEEYDAEIHIHLAETKGEVENCLKEYGKTPIALMEEVGILSRGVLAAHCVHLTDEDIAIMKKHNVRVAHNPGSNMKLASGVAPVPKMLEAGICVGLGTDGASSNNNLDMLEEVNLATLLHKVHNFDPLAVPAFKGVQMGTEYGAEAVGLKDVGLIKEGYKADIVLFDMNEPQCYPRHDLISLLAYSMNSSMVNTVLVNGKVLVENKQLMTIDEEKIKYEANRCTNNLLNR